MICSPLNLLSFTQLKNLRLIFVFIFLSGMLFTVIQFIPLLEEENASHRVELCKKINTNDTDGNGDGSCDDNCNDDDLEHDIFLDARVVPDACLENIQQQYIHGACFYEHLHEKKFSPPPKL